jgi:hypothetical protein
MRLADLTIPTNPQFDWSTPAAEQLEFVNPVTLANYEILLANYALEVTQSIVGTNRKIRDAKEAARAAKYAHDDFQHELLRTHPAPAIATKSLTLLAGYVRNTAVTVGCSEEFLKLQQAMRSAETVLERLDIELDNSQQVWDMIRLLGVHVQTHLSFVKSDLKQSGRYV